MKTIHRLRILIERNRNELSKLAEKHNFDFQHKAVINKSRHIDKLLNQWTILNKPL